jgi:SAM-dependent methyltransferase
MYPWLLGNGVQTPLLGPNLAQVHQTRAELVEPVVRDALARAGPEPTALDLACNEGWFSQLLLDWGAARVVGVDVRASNIRRARLMQEHYGIPEDALEFVQANVGDLDPGSLGSFDVVLNLGLLYHLEEPLRLLRTARRLTRGTCIVETQVTRQKGPVTFGMGSSGSYLQTTAAFAGYVEIDAATNALASTEGTMSLVPNRAAVRQMLLVAGFRRVEFLQPAAHHDLQYVLGDRVIATAS